MELTAVLSNLEWRQPLWLLLVLQPIAMGILRRLQHRRTKQVYADSLLLPWVLRGNNAKGVQRIFSRRNLYLIMWLLFAIAAAGPRLPLQEAQGNTGEGVDIFVVLDLSRSMTASDIDLDRMTRAKIELRLLLQRIKQHQRSDRVGIIVFAGRAHVLNPLTKDFDAVDYYLQSLTPDLLPTTGSNMLDGLVLAKKELTSSSHPHKAVLLLSDGDIGSTFSATKTSLLETARELENSNIPLYVLGVGTVEGEAIPLAEGGWLKDQGRPVITRLNEQFLLELANTGGGHYARVSDDDHDWSLLYENGIAKLSPPKVPHSQFILWQELYAWALVPALFLLFWFFYPINLNKNRSAQFFLISSVTLFAVLIVNSLLINPVMAADDPVQVEQNAYTAYKSGDHITAAKLYGHIPGYQGRMGEGASDYRMADYKAAIRQFSQAVLEAEDNDQRASALLNLGNSYFQLGDYASAIAIYQDALLYRPEYKAAQTNLAFTIPLQKAVEHQLTLQLDRSAGRGPLTAPLGNRELDVDNSAISIQQSYNKKKQQPPLPTPPIPKASDLSELIARGLRHAQSQGGYIPEAEQQTHKNVHNLAAARLRMKALEHQQSNLWKRLFEMEEGFPAPLDQPRDIPGTAPW